jgi:hypothetical protein
MITSHVLESSDNELYEICQCFPLPTQYLSGNLVAELRCPEYEFGQLGEVRWRDLIRMLNKRKGETVLCVLACHRDASGFRQHVTQTCETGCFDGTTDA